MGFLFQRQLTPQVHPLRVSVETLREAAVHLGRTAGQIAAVLENLRDVHRSLQFFTDGDVLSKSD